MRDQLDVAGVPGLVKSVDGAAMLVVVTLGDVGVTVSDVLTLGVGVGVGQSVPVGLGDVALEDGVTLVLVVTVGVGHGVDVGVDGCELGVVECELGALGVGDDFVVGFGLGLGGMPNGGPGLATGTITCGGAG
ncbi:MAG: hypothetical protein QOG98_3874, partial [Pseudonocardiales bacterium]|nr:hypothetical protein [Pseudonocardiales bacterium]